MACRSFRSGAGGLRADEIGSGLMSRPLGRACRVMLWVGVPLLMAAAEAGGVSAGTLWPAVQVALTPVGRRFTNQPFLPLLRFVNGTTVAAAFIAHNGVARPPVLPHRGEAVALLYVSVFDANTGDALNTIELPTDDPHYSGLLAGTDSELLVKLGDRVALYDGDLCLIKEVRLPGPEGSVWQASASPTGRNVLLADRGPRRSTWVWLDARTLRVVRTWRVDQPYAAALRISDDYITFAPCRPSRNRLPCKLTVWPLDGGPAGSIGGIGYVEGGPSFASNTLLFAPGWPPPGFSVIDLRKRRPIFEQPPPASSAVFGPPVPAANAARFVVPGFPSVRWQRLTWLNILDGPSARLRIVSVRGVPYTLPRWWSYAWSSFWLALSPDGKLLAVMPNFKTLLIYKLPPPKRH